MVLLLRHGQTAANVAHQVRPKSAALTDAGKEAAEVAGQASDGLPLKAIVTSPLPRAKETADRWGKAVGVPVMIDPNLRARDMGALEGKAVASVTGLLDKLAAHPAMKPPGNGESVKGFVEGRYWPAVKGLIASPELYGVVSHGSGVKAIELMLSKQPLTHWKHEPQIAPGQFALVTKDGLVPLTHDGLAVDSDHAGAGSEAPPSS